MKILSLFDGMACGALAMQSAGIEIDKYIAYEIDKYAIQTAQHNFPFEDNRSRPCISGGFRNNFTGVKRPNPPTLQ